MKGDAVLSWVPANYLQKVLENLFLFCFISYIIGTDYG
jgi:hypothetical protein